MNKITITFQSGTQQYDVPEDFLFIGSIEGTYARLLQEGKTLPVELEGQRVYINPKYVMAFAVEENNE